MLDKENILSQYEETEKLISSLEKDQWIDSETILICCTLKSSLPSLLINTHFQLEQLFLEYPEEDSTYIFNRDTRSYEPYERYIVDWVRKMEDKKYLFISTKEENKRAHTLLWNLVRKKHKCQFVTV